ncbi:MAG: XisH family protein [Polyangiaceae bacterium]|nr:XisH family protein [Polyangiaceae bacterium]
MPQRDTFHTAVKTALERDGWTITDDPLLLAVGIHKVYVDLGAERLLAAARGSERIAVEIKSFVGPSPVSDFERALGQYVLYRTALRRREPERTMVLAMPRSAYDALLESELGRAAREDLELVVMVFDPLEEVIWKWLP